jgi:hypothetical protein
LPTLNPVREPVAETARVRLLSRDGMLCAALLGLAILATWPVAEIGINDDWSSIRTAQLFAQTHHFIYNGWLATMLGWQIVWGALFARIFGPSHTNIRLSLVPVALVTSLLYHAILRRFGLNRAHAIFGTLALTLSPLFLALAGTFMTDVSGLFSILLCLYLCQRAIAAEEDSHAAMWLVLAGLTNILSGTVRQISWLGVLVMVPCCGWLLRRRRFIIPSTVVTWIVGAISIHWLLAWFLRHPYSIPETVLREHIGIHALQRIVAESWRSAMSTLLFLLPILIAFAAAVWPPRRSQLIRAVSVFSALAILYLVLGTKNRADTIVYPWLAGNIITPHGVMQDPPLFGSVRQASIGWQLLVLAIFVLAVLGTLEAIWASHRRERQPLGRQNRRILSSLVLPLLLAYCLLLIPRAAFIIIFDRYLLVIIAFILIYMLQAHQERVSAQIPSVATATLIVMALLGIAATHDLFAINRAEVRLLRELQQAGVPRLQIRGGFDFDSVTEVVTTGHLNDPGLVNPPGSYHEHLGTPDEMPPCGYPYLRYVPSLHIRYVISADPTPCLGPTNFPRQSYRTWLPPARRELFIGVPSAISPLHQP